MNVHVSILEQLGIREAQTGEKCVPRHPQTERKMEYVSGMPTLGHAPQWFTDLERHIREAGLLAVMKWCEERNRDVRLLQGKRHSEGGVPIQDMWIDYDDNHRFRSETLGTGPTLAHAIDAALKKINKESKS